MVMYNMLDIGEFESGYLEEMEYKICSRVDHNNNGKIDSFVV